MTHPSERIARDKVPTARLPLHTIVLVSMPFGPLLWPSIGLSLLKGGLGAHRTSTRIHYFTLAFADLIGHTFYAALSDGAPSVAELSGDWIFSGALFGPDQSAERQYVEEILIRRSALGRRSARRPPSSSTAVSRKSRASSRRSSASPASTSSTPRRLRWRSGSNARFPGRSSCSAAPTAKV
jgi:hypothetical protein